jgi:hypothetical protein
MKASADSSAFVISETCGISEDRNLNCSEAMAVRLPAWKNLPSIPSRAFLPDMWRSLSRRDKEPTVGLHPIEKHAREA